MMLYDGGMNGTGNGHQMMMNGGGEFLGDFGPSRDMPAQYVLSNELLCRIDNSTKKQVLLKLLVNIQIEIILVIVGIANWIGTNCLRNINQF